MEFIYKGLGHVMRFCYYTIGFENYALALLWFALFVKLLLLPFGIKQQKNQIKGAKLRPKVYAIEKKYAGRTDQITLRKKQQEIMEMQQKEGYSPLAGCLPLLIQLPLILILYKIIQKPLSYLMMIDSAKIAELAKATGIDAGQEIKIIGSIFATGVDSFKSILGDTLLPNFNLFGIIDLSTTPEFWTWALLIPALVFGSQFFTMKLSRLLNPSLATSNQSREAAMSLTIMDFAMPAMTLIFAFNLPAALGLYWIYQSVFSIIQMVVLAKLMPLPTFTEEELKAAERALRGKGRRVIGTGSGATAVTTYDDELAEAPVRPRSLHYIDEDDDDIPAAPVKRPANQQRKQPQRPNGQRQNGQRPNGAPKATNGKISAAPMKDDRKNDK